jgi:cytosine/adenosine deaminase-related metal-dependent hydrolase
MSDSYIIRNATVVSMDEQIGVRKNCDVHVEGQIIKAVEPNIPDIPDASVIDGTDAIVSPGFVDSHRHMWQTQLAGLLSDHTLMDYFGHVRLVYASCYTPWDVEIGQYAGALQCIDAGTTYVLDHSHIMNSSQHSDAAVRGLLESGIRGTFCYGFFVNNPAHWADIDTGITTTKEGQPDWRLEDSKRIKETFFANNDATQRLRFGIAPSELDYQPLETAINEIQHARSLDSAVITSHVAIGYVDTAARMVRKLNDKSMLASDLHFSHGAALQVDELAAMKECDCGLTATPDTELQASHHSPKTMCPHPFTNALRSRRWQWVR